jgi:multisubunit Na+/H+ antiporter MnhE subunit
MRTAAVVAVLATIWVLSWGSASIANIVTGVLVGTALVMLVAGLRGTKQPLVIRPARHRPAARAPAIAHPHRHRRRRAAGLL